MDPVPAACASVNVLRATLLVLSDGLLVLTSPASRGEKHLDLEQHTDKLFGPIEQLGQLGVRLVQVV